MKLIRRDFFRTVMVGIGGLGILGTEGRLYALQHATENTGKLAAKCQFFNEKQAIMLEAVVDQIIPPDDFPGAKDAGVLYFIDNALTKWEPQHRWDYVAGLEGIDDTSLEMFDTKFVDLEWGQQTEVIEAVDNGLAAGKVWKRLNFNSPGNRRRTDEQSDEPNSRRFLDIVIRHTMQGYYGDPKYGGNKGQASWKMLGYRGLK